MQQYLYLSSLCWWGEVNFLYVPENAYFADPHILALPEGLCALELPEVNPGGQPQEAGSDSKLI